MCVYSTSRFKMYYDWFGWHVEIILNLLIFINSHQCDSIEQDVNNFEKIWWFGKLLFVCDFFLFWSNYDFLMSSDILFV